MADDSVQPVPWVLKVSTVGEARQIGLFSLINNRFTVSTPNIPETEYLSGIKINNEADILCAARKLQEKGCNAILIKGGHIPGVEVVYRSVPFSHAYICPVNERVIHIFLG